MLQRLLAGWTFRRLLYLGLGTAVIIYAVANREWFAVLFGAYFASMGIFAFGCAGENCVGGICNTKIIDPNPSKTLHTGETIDN